MTLIFSLSIIFITTIPVLFPALFSITFEKTFFDKVGILDSTEIAPFEVGLFFPYVILTNMIVFGVFFILKFKKIQKIPNLNISKKYSLIILSGLILLFLGLSYQNLTLEDQHKDWVLVKENIEQWPPENWGSFELHVRKFLLNSSFWIFGNYSIVPFLSSIVLLIVIYFFTNKISNNSISGLVAVGFMLQSNLFLSFSSIPTYTIFWVLFYLISTYTIIQSKWFFSPISYVLAILSKPIVVMFLPLTIFFVLNSKIKKRNKIGIIIITLSIVTGGAYFAVGDNPTMYEGFDFDDFMIGFASFSYQMRFDFMSVIFLFPIIIGLFLISKEKNYANNISIIISGILLSTPILVGLTDITSQPYRFVPLVVFLAIAVGMIIGHIQIPKKIEKTRKRKTKQI